MDMAKDPWNRLRVIGWIAITLSTFALFRLFPLDWPGIAASLWCGFALIRRRPSAFLATAIAGGIVLADAVLSMVLMGPILLKELESGPDSWSQSPIPFLLPQLLLYALQAMFWPWAAATAMRNQRGRGISCAYSVHSRDTVIGSFCVSAWISLVVQMWAKTLIFRLV